MEGIRVKLFAIQQVCRHGLQGRSGGGLVHIGRDLPQKQRVRAKFLGIEAAFAQKLPIFRHSGGFFGGQPIERPDWPEKGDGDVEIPPQPTQPVVTQGTVQLPQGEQPENMPVPPMTGEGTEMPTPPIPEGSENMPMPQPPAGVELPQGSKQPVQVITGTLSTDFPIREGANYFTNLRPVA